MIESGRKRGPLSRFFAFCSGSSYDLLECCPDSDWTKATSNGVLVFLTGMLASISGGYALYQVFNRLAWAIPLGMLWGVLIFSLDRYLVGSLRKRGGLVRQLGQASPRFLLAGVIAVVIAQPLEVFIFRDQIGRQIDLMRRAAADSDDRVRKNRPELVSLRAEKDKVSERMDNARTAMDRDPVTPAFIEFKQRGEGCAIALASAIRELDAQRPGLQADRRRLRQAIDLDDARRREIEERRETILRQGGAADGLGSEFQQVTTKVAGLRAELSRVDRRLGDLSDAVTRRQRECGAIGRRVEDMRLEHFERQKEELGRATDEISDLEVAESTVLKENEEEKERFAVNIERDYSENFVRQLEAFGTLTRKRFSWMWWLQIIITLFFFLLETTPITAKLLAPRGSYDTMLDAEEEDLVTFNRELARDVLMHKARERAKLAMAANAISAAQEVVDEAARQRKSMSAFLWRLAQQESAHDAAAGRTGTGLARDLQDAFETKLRNAVRAATSETPAPRTETEPARRS